MNWKDFFDALMKDFRVSVYELAAITGVTQPTLNRLRAGVTALPNQNTIRRLEEGLNIKIDDRDPGNISYQRLPEHSEASANPRESGNSIQAISHPFTDVVSLPPVNRFPVVSLIGAGSITPYEDEPIGYIDIPYPDKNCVALRIIGDSMAPRLEEKDIILVSNTEKPQPGDIVAVRTKKGEQMIKRYANKSESGLLLLSDNPAYQMQTIPISELVTVRKVVFAVKTFQTPGLTFSTGAI